MNISTKCNCCVCEQVCAYKQIYENGVKAILNTNIQYGNGAFCELRNYPHIEVSIRCPHMVTRTPVKSQQGGNEQ